MLKFVKRIFVLLLFLMFGYAPLIAQHGHNDVATGDESHSVTHAESEEEFEPGDYIIHHVLDAHDWHIVSFGDKHISVPLPVILYSQNPELHGGQKLHVFLSSKFHHGHSDYKNFMLSHSGKDKGKIVEINDQGNVIGKPVDLSITKAIAGAIVAAIILVWLILSTARHMRRNKGQAPKGVQNLVEPVVLFIRDEVAKPAIGDKKYEKFMPFLLSLFFFILLNNLLGLIPIFPFGANVTGNIAVTLVFALFTFFVTHIKANKHYWKELYNPDVPWWLKFPIPLMPIVEISGVFTKPFVLMVRLFANMLAGHLIVTVFISLIFIFGNLMGPTAGFAVSPVSMVFSVFILLLDVLVSFIQAYVFTLLSAIYFGMATSEHH